LSITEYVIPLGEDARKRHYHESDKGKVITVDISKNFQSELEQAIDKWYTKGRAEEN